MAALRKRGGGGGEGEECPIVSSVGNSQPQEGRGKIDGVLAALIPPPRVRRHRYAGVLAPSSPRWLKVSAQAEAEPEAEPVTPLRREVRPLEESAAPAHRSCTRYLGRRGCGRGSTRPFRWLAPCAGRRCV
jgi:hypothetical protein